MRKTDDGNNILSVASREAIYGHIRRWTDYLPSDVYDRLCNCSTTSQDISVLTDAKWRRMIDLGKDREGFIKEDALVFVLELLDSNGIDTEMDKETYESLCR